MKVQSNQLSGFWMQEIAQYFEKGRYLWELKKSEESSWGRRRTWDRMKEELTSILLFMGFPGGWDSKGSILLQGGRPGFLGWEDPGVRARQPTPVFLPRESPMDRGAWWASPWDCISWTQLQEPRRVEVKLFFLLYSDIKWILNEIR